jgi:tyrosyl-tRNA synthetase
MDLKKELASRIVKDFYSAEVASDATEEWASQVQKRELPEEMELVAISMKEVGPEPIKLARVLKAVGLAPSVSYATLKIKEGAVSVNEVKTKDLVAKVPIDQIFVLRLGHRVREVRIVSATSSTSWSS